MYQKYTKTTADKKKLPLQGSLILLAEKPGFEPGLRGYRTTPLAGAPLQPLEYFSTIKVLIAIFSCLSIISYRKRFVKIFFRLFYNLNVELFARSK